MRTDNVYTHLNMSTINALLELSHWAAWFKIDFPCVMGPGSTDPLRVESRVVLNAPYDQRSLQPDTTNIWALTHRQ